MRTVYGFGQVFKHNGNQYEIEYDLHYDAVRYSTTLTKIQAWGRDVHITAEVLKAAEEIAEAAGEQEWLGLIENAGELE